jgi:B12-binding domain/radical SAM domain protein
MPHADLILLHAPSVFDFRKRQVAYGPVSDVVPSTPVFEMYPLGFLTLANYLAKHGLTTRIANIALRMLWSKKFDPEKFLSRLRPRAFGIDLHWLVHAHGSMELARLVKRLHPDIPIIFGGLSATYFHDELIRMPFVDFVVRGDTTDKPLVDLMRALGGKGGLEDVPNLVWKRGDEVVCNEFSYVPESLDHLSMDYGTVIRSAVRHGDPTALLPFRGCKGDCVICGGSCSAYRKFYGRKKLGIRNPEGLAEDLIGISRLCRGPIVILGDLRMGGEGYAERFFECAERSRVKNSVVLELHRPADREFLERAGRAFRHLAVQLSPESHDSALRCTFGRRYDGVGIDDFLTDARELCDRVDLFFMVGLPEQTPASVASTVEFSEQLIEEQAHGGKVHPHIAPLAPFLDPGSRAFENPDEHGYTLYRRTLADHSEALLAPTWHEILNYRTKWMSREDIASAIYDAARKLNRAKARFGLISKKELARIEGSLDKAGGMSKGGPEDDGETVAKQELRWPGSAIPVRPLAAFKEVVAALIGT